MTKTACTFLSFVTTLWMITKCDRMSNIAKWLKKWSYQLVNLQSTFCDMSADKVIVSVVLQQRPLWMLTPTTTQPLLLCLPLITLLGPPCNNPCALFWVPRCRESCHGQQSSAVADRFWSSSQQKSEIFEVDFWSPIWYYQQDSPVWRHNLHHCWMMLSVATHPPHHLCLERPPWRSVGLTSA